MENYHHRGINETGVDSPLDTNGRNSIAPNVSPPKSMGEALDDNAPSLKMNPTSSPRTIEQKPIVAPSLPLIMDRQRLERQAGASRAFLKRWQIASMGAIAIGVGLVIGLPRLSFLQGNTTQIADVSVNDILEVSTIRLEPESSYDVTRTYTGEVASLRSSDLGFERSGTLEWVGVNRGDRVSRGTPVARLDIRNLEAQRTQIVAQREQARAILAELQKGPRQEDINAAQATVRDLEDQLELQRIRQQRREYLVEEGAISREQLDEVAFGANALEDRLDAARSEVEELLAGTRPEQIAAQQAAVDQLSARITDLDITIDKSTIKAPFDGIIGERQQDEGTVVGAGQAVVRVLEAAQPEVEIGLPADSLRLLPLGSTHSVEIGNERYTTTVQSILPEVDPTTRTRTVVMQLQGVDSSIVAPGQIARFDVKNSISDAGYWVPSTALVQGEKGLWNAYAVATSENGSDESNLYQVERRVIDVLHTEGDRMFVQGTLQPGDRLIADGAQRVVPGQYVQLADADTH